MKTIKDIYEAVLIEQNKIQAPSLKLYEFNYFLNKAIQQVINKKYNFCEVNQQITDDLLPLIKHTEFTRLANNIVDLPEDYWHLLNCICTFGKENCGNYKISAIKATSNAWGEIINNYYNRPSSNKPYFKILGNQLIIESGDSLPIMVELEYLKIPTTYELTEDHMYEVDNDSSAKVDFPEYMIREIINELIYLALERVSDPRIQTNPQITQTIAVPTQQAQS